LGFAGAALGVDRPELDSRLHTLTAKFQAMQAKPDKCIPAQVLRDAQGIILLDRTKAGFLFAYEGGSGVAMVRDPRTRAWSAPAFVSANQASLGFQAGGQQTFVVVLIMNTNTVRSLATGSFSFGGEASGTAGNTSGGASGTVSSVEQLTMVYHDSEGLYGGVAVKGGNVSPDAKADIAYYGQYLSAEEILFEHKVRPTERAFELTQAIEQASRAR
jgi:lipid-binding SYLF domain-containing protein